MARSVSRIHMTFCQVSDTAKSHFRQTIHSSASSCVRHEYQLTKASWHCVSFIKYRECLLGSQGARMSATVGMNTMPESASLMKFTELKTLKMVSLTRQKQKHLYQPSTLPPVPRLCLLTRPPPITPASVSKRYIF
jgi:hypothetical protein